MAKKAAYQPVPAPYARVAAAKMAQLEESRTDGGPSLEISGDRENEVGPGNNNNNNIPTDLMAEENKQLRESIYLRTLLAKERYPPSP